MREAQAAMGTMRKQWLGKSLEVAAKDKEASIVVTGKKREKPSKREQVGADVGRQITMMPGGTSSIRSTFHNFPVDSPAPSPSQGMTVNQGRI